MPSHLPFSFIDVKTFVAREWIQTLASGFKGKITDITTDK